VVPDEFQALYLSVKGLIRECHGAEPEAATVAEKNVEKNYREQKNECFLSGHI